ncbi:5-formyltetrahydrofolate cyclo-ligase [Halosimplex salinum]|uniref:5-formyltetrahydrofolate cyclo-ligase n=1 Tax=Halosimplex salinum TaxID=1710538 RepID=UPI000F477CD2|nr:5-formyltetrahydrofolate cyclo-ligase [Halosimplex salinum]
MAADKESLRQTVWDHLEDSGEARFPFPPHGRIPNFAGADAAAERLADLPEWADARTLKANPDAPQLPARRAALAAGKTVYMAVPRLRDERCFYRLDPADLDDPDAAATVSGVDDHAEQVGPEAVDRVDLVLVGSVAVSPDGARVGKGEGYSDLEFAVLTELGLVDAETTVVTTVHESQVRDGIGADAHDVPLDVIVTPERVVRTETSHERPDGIDWAALSDEQIEEIPVLDRFAP